MNTTGRTDLDIGATDKASLRKKQESRRKLLAAARKLFSERGYHATRPQDISREAGVGYGTFYLQFEDKLDCFMAFTQEASRELNEFVAPYQANAVTFPEHLAGILNGSFDYSHANPGVLRAVLEDVRILSIYERGPSNTGAAAMLRRIERWQQEGVISSSLNSKLLGYLISGVVRQGDALINQKSHSKNDVLENIMLFLVRGAGYGRSAIHPVWDVKKLSGLRPSPMSGPIQSTVEKTNGPSQRKINNRRKLFSAARKLFAEQGYDAVGPKEIAALAGVGMGTFYSHFEDKLDCFLAVTDEAAEEHFHLTLQYLSAATTFEEIVHFFILAPLDYSAANPGIFRMLVADLRILQSDQKVHARGVERLVAYIERFKQLGKIAEGFDSKVLAYLLIAMIRQSDAYVTRFPERREQVIENVTQFVLQAIST